MISSWNYREVDIKLYNHQKRFFWELYTFIVYQFFSLSNISFGCIKETSQRDFSFTNPKHVIIGSY